MIIDAKQQFQEVAKANRWTWGDTVSSTMFQQAVLASLTHMAHVNSCPPDMATAASFAYRMEGAKQLLAILINLMENPQSPKRENNNLNYRA